MLICHSNVLFSPAQKNISVQGSGPEGCVEHAQANRTHVKHWDIFHSETEMYSGQSRSKRSWEQTQHAIQIQSVWNAMHGGNYSWWWGQAWSTIQVRLQSRLEEEKTKNYFKCPSELNLNFFFLTTKPEGILLHNQLLNSDPFCVPDHLSPRIVPVLLTQLPTPLLHAPYSLSSCLLYKKYMLYFGSQDL